MIDILNLKKILDLREGNYYVVMDFDNTITAHNSSTTFSLFGKSNLYPPEYEIEMNKIHQFYRPLELDLSLDEEKRINYSKEWLQASYNLFLKYKVRESDIKRIIEDDSLLVLRNGAINFINMLNIKNIPLIINSAGIGNFIVEVLKQNNCYTNNIYVNSNMLEFENDFIVDKLAKVIHSMNKYDISLPNDYLTRIVNYKYAIVIGDQLSDIKMASKLPKEDIISIGFLESNINENEREFIRNFDVVLYDNEDFFEVKKLLKIK